MRNYIIVILLCIVSLFNACSKNADNILRVGVSADYPPFEFKEGDTFKGFDIELIHQIARGLGKEVVFVDTSFTTLFPMLNTGRIDVAISCITATEERKKNFDFSVPYYFDTIVMLVRRNSGYTSVSDMEGKKIGVQLGTTMQLWAEEKSLTKHLNVMDNVLSLVEALKVGHLDGVLIDKMQAYSFMEKNADLVQFIVEQSDEGYSIAFIKNSPYTEKINSVLEKFAAQGVIADLAKKWLVHAQ